MIREFAFMLRYAKRSLRRRIASWRNDMSAWRRFWDAYLRYRRIAPRDRRPSYKHLYPCLGDDTAVTPVGAIYFYQDSWAFEKIVNRRPELHVDVGSHHKFVALLSRVVPLVMVDIRPLSLPLDSLGFRKGSILDLPYEDGSVASVSSLCVIEHVGLGRYGAPLDPFGSEKAIEELKRIVRPGGDLYLSLPLCDENRTYFNAHRAFREDYVLALLQPFEIVERRYICGREFCAQRKPGFGTGCYHLRRPT